VHDGRELQHVGGDQEAVSVTSGGLDSLEGRAYHHGVTLCRYRDPRNDIARARNRLTARRLYHPAHWKLVERRTSVGRWCINERGSCAT